MQRIRVAIIEDDPEDRKQIGDCLEKYSQEATIPLEISFFPDGETFLKKGREFQILFMDIEMPGRNGIKIAEELRNQGKDVVIVLVTNMVQYAIHGYAVRAADYLVKPVSYEQIQLKMPYFCSLIRRKQKELTIKTREGIRKIPAATIRYIEIYGHNIMIHLRTGTVECYGSLKQFTDELEDYGFIKCSQSCLVNLAYVEGIFQDIVKIGEDSLPVSRREKKRFLSAFTKFDGGQG